MVKTILLRILVFLLTSIGMTLTFLGLYSYFLNHSLSVHDAGASVVTWLDENEDGKQTSGESTLPNVCVWAGYVKGFTDWEIICNSQRSLTDLNGNWSDFFAGGSCNEIFIAAYSPQGYYPTTPTIMNGCSAKFGFTSDESFGKISQLEIKQVLQKADEKQNLFRWLEFITLFILVSAI